MDLVALGSGAFIGFADNWLLSGKIMAARNH